MYHKDGSIWAKGRMLGDNPDDYWQWFRSDGTIMRSGYFKNGRHKPASGQLITKKEKFTK